MNELDAIVKAASGESVGQVVVLGIGAFALGCIVGQALRVGRTTEQELERVLARSVIRIDYARMPYAIDAGTAAAPGSSEGQPAQDGARGIGSSNGSATAAAVIGASE